MKNIFTIKALLVLLLYPTISNGQEVQGEILSEDNNITIVRVWGTHEERGYAVGYLLADKITDLYENFIVPAFGTYLSAARMIISDPANYTIREEYVNEAIAMIEGIADAGYEIGATHTDILLSNSFLDLSNLNVLKMEMGNGCSSLLSWGEATEDSELEGKSVITRHMDWNDVDAIIRNQVMVIHLPEEEDEQPWLMIGFAGQMSVLSGFNQSGLAVMQHMLADDSSKSSLGKAYEPIWFTLRKIIEKKDFNGDGENNTKDILDGIVENVNGYGDGYIITGIAPNVFDNDSLTAIIAEISPSTPYISARYNTYDDDHIPGDNLYAANFSVSRNDAQNICVRYDSIIKYIDRGLGIGAEESWDLMLNYSSTCAFGGPGNIQFMQYIPEDNFLKLSTHLNDGIQACQNTPMIFDTEELFTKSTSDPSIGEIHEMESAFRIYPNPFNNKTTIEITSSDFQNSVFRVYSIDGRLIRQTNIMSTTTEISELNPGIYILGLYKNGKIISRKKIISIE